MTAQMTAQRGELEAEIHASASAVTRQMYVAILGQMAVLLGFAYFFATHLRRPARSKPRGRVCPPGR